MANLFNLDERVVSIMSLNSQKKRISLFPIKLLVSRKKKSLTQCYTTYILNKEGDSVSPSGYLASVMTAVFSRIAQSPFATTPSTRKQGRPLQYPLRTTSQPSSSTISMRRPQMTSARYPEHAAAFTTPWPPYWNQKTTTSMYNPQRPTINTTPLKSQEERLRLEQKLEIAGEGNQVFKRPRGRGRGRGPGDKRGRRLRAGSVRLVSADGLPDRGRVEIFIRGEWGTVCDDLFTNKAGNVVCRQLGFTRVLMVMKRAALGEADSSVRILLDDVECEGGESSLLQCKRARVGKHNCSHGEDVGVICG